MMQQLIQPLYSKSQFRLRNIPNIDTYIQNRVQLASYDLDDLTIKVAEASDFQQLTNTLDKFRRSTRIAERTAREDVCVVAYKHGALAHVRWAALKSHRPCELEGQRVHLQPDEAWTFDAYTLPAFRRQGISSEAKIFLMKYLAQQGIRCTYSDSRIDNTNSEQSRIKKIREGRLRILGLITLMTLLGRTRCIFTTDTPAIRPLIARLFKIPIHTVQLRDNPRRSIDRF